MNRKALDRKWYFIILRVLFWIIFAFFFYLGVWGILYEDDIPLAGFFWAIVTAIIYWLIKKAIYYFVEK